MLNRKVTVSGCQGSTRTLYSAGPGRLVNRSVSWSTHTKQGHEDDLSFIQTKLRLCNADITHMGFLTNIYTLRFSFSSFAFLLLQRKYTHFSEQNCVCDHFQSAALFHPRGLTWCMMYFNVSQQWYGCQCWESFHMCTDVNVCNLHRGCMDNTESLH